MPTHRNQQKAQKFYGAALDRLPRLLRSNDVQLDPKSHGRLRCMPRDEKERNCQKVGRAKPKA